MVLLEKKNRNEREKDIGRYGEGTRGSCAAGTEMNWRKSWDSIYNKERKVIYDDGQLRPGCVTVKHRID